MVLALMNIVTGIFVNDAVAMAQRDLAIVQETQAQLHAVHIAQLSAVFSETDTDGSGSITPQELEAACERDDVKNILHCMGIDVQDALDFFNVLDVDHSQELEV